MVAASQPRMALRNDITIGGGASYRLGIKEEFSAMGINLESYFYFVDEFRAGLDLHYYLVDFDFSPAAWEANLNTGVLVLEDRDVYIYGLIGLQFLWIDYDWGEEFGKDKHYGFGVNLGGSVEYDIDFLKIYAEPKITLYTVNKFRIASTFSLGIRYTF